MATSKQTIILILITFLVNQTNGCPKGKKPEPPPKKCPSDFVHRHFAGIDICLYFSTEKGTFSEAVQMCKDKGFKIFQPYTSQLFEILTWQTDGNIYYIGLSQSGEDGIYRWVDNSDAAEIKFLSQAFYDGKLNFNHVEHPCAVYSFTMNRRLMGASCYDPHNFVCEAPFQ